MKYQPKMGRALHDTEANLHFSEQAGADQAGYLEETSSELGLLSREAVSRKNRRNKT